MSHSSSSFSQLVATARSLRDQTAPKGDVLIVAKIAGIQAAQKTSELGKSA